MRTFLCLLVSCVDSAKAAWSLTKRSDQEGRPTQGVPLPGPTNKSTTVGGRPLYIFSQSVTCGYHIMSSCSYYVHTYYERRPLYSLFYLMAIYSLLFAVNELLYLQ